MGSGLVVFYVCVCVFSKTSEKEVTNENVREKRMREKDPLYWIALGLIKPHNCFLFVFFLNILLYCFFVVYDS